MNNQKSDPRVERPPSVQVSPTFSSTEMLPMVCVGPTESTHAVLSCGKRESPRHGTAVKVCVHGREGVGRRNWRGEHWGKYPQYCEMILRKGKLEDTVQALCCMCATIPSSESPSEWSVAMAILESLLTHLSCVSRLLAEDDTVLLCTASHLLAYKGAKAIRLPFFHPL